MTLDFDLQGVTQFVASLDRLNAEVPKVAAASLHQSAEATMTRSKSDFCPVDTGFLKSSGTVQTRQDGPVIETTLGYSANYAIYVHEINKNYRHGKQWKYLETPLKQDLPKYEADMRAAMEDLLK